MKQTFHPEGNRLRINTYQDVEPHLEHAQRMRREFAERGVNPKSAFRPRTSAPFNVILGIAKKLGIPPSRMWEPEENARIWKEINSSDYKRFRLRDGKRL